MGVPAQGKLRLTHPRQGFWTEHCCVPCCLTVRQARLRGKQHRRAYALHHLPTRPTCYSKGGDQAGRTHVRGGVRYEYGAVRPVIERAIGRRWLKRVDRGAHAGAPVEWRAGVDADDRMPRNRRCRRGREERRGGTASGGRCVAMPTVWPAAAVLRQRRTPLSSIHFLDNPRRKMVHGLCVYDKKVDTDGVLPWVDYVVVRLPPALPARIPLLREGRQERSGCLARAPPNPCLCRRRRS